MISTHMPASAVRLEQEGFVSVLTIDRPEAGNAIARSTIREIASALEDVAGSDARILVVRGGGDRVFVSGGDLKELAEIRTLDGAESMAGEMRAVLDMLATLPIPVLSAINGHAFGGGAEVAVACDIRLAADDVNCAFNQVRLGIMPAWGGIERLTAITGRGRALALMTSGRVISASDAFGMGLFDEIVPRAEFEARWRELASQIASAPRDALVGIKAAQQAAFPAAHPTLAPAAVGSFARTWVSDTHWEMVAEAEAKRRASRNGA
jgi:enoyl-CoA hydratase/carnithine racemase